MTIAPLPENEQDRLQALRRYQILDTESDELFDSIATLAATVCDVPIALVSLIDEDRQWFKAKVGLEAQETSRDLAFCAHAILNPDELLVVPDATQDSRFHDNPLVTGSPDIRFYAGAPIVTKDKQALGTLCVIDTKAHQITERQREALTRLSKQVCANLELRLAHKKLELLNESKNRFFSILSHDLRSPINSILSLADLLADPDSGLSAEEVEEFHRHLLTNAQVTSRTAENLLQMVQFEEGRFTFEPKLLNLREILSAAEGALAGRSSSKNITIRTQCQPALQVWADPRLFQSIVQNLLSNALKFSHPDGRINIVARSDSDSVTLLVEDFGVGIKEHNIPKIFALDASHSTVGTAGEQGSGLGLNLCKQFASRLNGDLKLESEYGQGTRVHLTLPASAPV
ncbi:GAF domain-containing sensor histidine kinase [Pelagicoccus mobilis]|uniref:histidine kinase n=1 Tax=Pelagicoccus mobilis TaxID=415221 RepID=A0A934RX67_9BACT|nr:GAF domain-containing sensor histidine kinase [Pelagicoccus mobilis]MBK1878186.1 GAF domain-containing sensor histidine kinase [Pelagicoccus mobilis]